MPSSLAQVDGDMTPPEQLELASLRRVFFAGAAGGQDQVVGLVAGRDAGVSPGLEGQEELTVLAAEVTPALGQLVAQRGRAASVIGEGASGASW